MSRGSVGQLFIVREGGQLRIQVGGLPEQQQYWPISSGGIGTAARRADAVQKAIAVAQREGDVDSILLPDQLLNYDASLVTFDNDIKMLREGQIWDVYDVRAYGAHGDGPGGTDDLVAINAAASAADANGSDIVWHGSYTFTVSTDPTFPGTTTPVGDGASYDGSATVIKTLLNTISDIADLPAGTTGQHIRTIGSTPTWSDGVLDAGGAVANPMNEKYGAVGDGATNDRAALVLTDAADAPTLLPAGSTFLISANLTLSGDVVSYGGKIKPASGVTVTIDGRITANPETVLFDMSAGGTVAVTTYGEVSANWWSDDSGGTSEFGERVNNCLDASSTPNALKVVFYGSHEFSVPLNLTRLIQGREYDFTPCTLSAAIDAKPCIEMQQAKLNTLTRLTLGVASGHTPSVGLLMGRNAGGSGASEHILLKPKITGRFSIACLYNLGSESVTYIDTKFHNLTTTKSVTTFIGEYDVWGVAGTESYEPLLDNPATCEQHVFEGTCYMWSDSTEKTVTVDGTTNGHTTGAGLHTSHADAIVIAGNLFLRSGGKACWFLDQTVFNGTGGSLLAVVCPGAIYGGGVGSSGASPDHVVYGKGTSSISHLDITISQSGVTHTDIASDGSDEPGATVGDGWRFCILLEDMELNGGGVIRPIRSMRVRTNAAAKAINGLQIRMRPNTLLDIDGISSFDGHIDFAQGSNNKFIPCSSMLRTTVRNDPSQSNRFVFYSDTHHWKGRDAYFQRAGASGETTSHHTGSGSPEGVVTADVGSTYARRDGGAGTSFYVKESGTGNTGWVAK